MSTSLRQRRHRRDDENAVRAKEDDYNEMEIFIQQCKNATPHATGGWGISTMIFFRVASLFIFFLAIIITLSITALQWKSRVGSDASSSTTKDLKLITIYPRHISPYIHQMDGQTELLVTNENREAVNAIRTSIGMANNLRYNSKYYNRRIKRRKKMGWILGMTNFISSLRDDDDDSEGKKDALNRKGVLPGDVVLEAFDQVKVRNYLVEHGGQCSRHDHNDSNHVDESGTSASSDDYFATNTALLRYDELTTSMKTTDEDKLLDALWNRAIHIFTWCQFANGDARGYIAFDTSINKKSSSSPDGTDAVADSSTTSFSSLQEMLDEARSTGKGMAMKESQSRDDGALQEMVYDSVGGVVHYTPLFVLPLHDGTATPKETSREILHALLEEGALSTIITTPSMPYSSKQSLLFEITEESLQKLGINKT